MKTYLDFGYNKSLSRAIPAQGESSLDFKTNIKPGSILFSQVSINNPVSLQTFTVADLPIPIVTVGPYSGSTQS